MLVSVVLDTISFADPKFHAREMSLLGSRNATREDFLVVFQADARGLVRCERSPPIALRSKSRRRFPQWIKPETGVIKALIEI